MWTKGEAYKAIEKCAFNENHEGALRVTLNKLDERFGDPSQVANQMVEDIIGGKEVKSHDWKGLWVFIDEVELSDAAAKAAKGTYGPSRK